VLKLAQMAARALREWQADQAAEREAAGSPWQDTGREVMDRIFRSVDGEIPDIVPKQGQKRPGRSRRGGG
jgi:hypothetical protein